MAEEDDNKAGIITFESLANGLGDVWSTKTETKVEDNGIELIDLDDKESSLNLEDKTETAEEDDSKGEGGEGVDTLREKQEAPKGDDPKITPSSQSVFHNLLKKLGIESVVQEDESGAEVEVSIDNLDNLDEELYTEIVQSYLAKEKEEVSKDKISVDGVSDILKTAINIEKRGGKVSEILQQQQRYIDPLDNLDITTVDGQKQAISLYMTAMGKEPDDIRARLMLYEKEGVLEEKAEESDSGLRKAVADYAKKQEEALIEKEKEAKEYFKQYKKDFKSALDESFELNDNIKNKLSDFVTKQGDNKRIPFDDKLMEIRRTNPKMIAEIALFIQDREEFVKQITRKAVNETKVKTLIKIGSARGTKEGKIEGAQGGSRPSGNDFVPLGD